jgi:hypothetical protein
VGQDFFAVFLAEDFFAADELDVPEEPDEDFFAADELDVPEEPDEDFLAGDFFAAEPDEDFFAVDFFAVGLLDDFFAADELDEDFLAVELLDDFLAGELDEDFFAVELLEDFFAGDFFAVDFEADDFAADDFEADEDEREDVADDRGVEEDEEERDDVAAPAAFFAAPGAAMAVASVSFGSFFAPEMTFFRSAPGVNLGTDFFFVRTRSPVCGLRTMRALRTRFSNDPNPVMATFSPLATSRVMVSSTASSACAAAFLFPSKRPARVSMS